MANYKTDMMSKRRIIYYDTFSIAVINQSGKMRRLYTPFLVKCVVGVDGIYQNSTVYVDEVYPDPDEKLLYLIAGNLYAYDNFVIKTVC